MDMNGFDIDCELNYEVLEPGVFLFNIEAARTPEQRVLREQFSTLPALALDRYTDSVGNRFTRLQALAGPLSVRYTATVTVDELPSPEASGKTSVACLPPAVMPFLLASRYCESDTLFSLAARRFGALKSSYEQVEAVCEWIRANIDYEIGTSLVHGTARDVLLHRTGVCRDFAHVAIALCRALNIPARFVTGHVQWDTPPPDFHALFEAYLGGRWILFDPTAMAPTQNVVRIGAGRDATDVAFATIIGRARMTRMNPLTRMLSTEELERAIQSTHHVVQMLAQAA
jgi:transglutaminase-like putative cysteine protease